MATSKIIVQKLEQYTKIAENLFYRIAPWTTADQVTCDDGKDVQTKIGGIDGISDSLTGNSSRIAVSQKALSDLSDKFDDALGGSY